jgi:hypothetical protein
MTQVLKHIVVELIIFTQAPVADTLLKTKQAGGKD